MIVSHKEVFPKNKDYTPLLFPDFTSDFASLIFSSLISARIGTLAYDHDGSVKSMSRSSP